MRKSTLISLLMALLLLGCLAIWRYMPRALSYDECSSVYRHFADMQLEGVRVTCIKDKLVGDSVRVPVTLLEAETDRGWELLDSLFGYSKHINSILNNPDLPDDVKALFLDDYHVGTFMAHRETPEKRIASPSGAGRISLAVITLIPGGRIFMISAWGISPFKFE